MFKIEIETEDGKTLRTSRGEYLFFRTADGKETYYEWEHLAGRGDELAAVFESAGRIVGMVEDFLPEEPYPPLR